MSEEGAEEAIDVGGRPPHQPTAETRRLVESLSGFGVPHDDIAIQLDLDPKTLRKHYREQLNKGHIKANARVAENLFKHATGAGRSAVLAAIFWMKTRAGWKETVTNENVGKDGGAIQHEHKVTVEFVGPDDGNEV